MVVKRVTIEIDDRQDNLNLPTDMPDQLKHEQTCSSTEEAQTGEATLQEDDKVEQNNKDIGRIAKKKTGRTYSDLFIEIKDDSRCVIMFFTIISFIMFSLQLKYLTFTEYFIFSFSTSLIFNIIWFFTPFLFKKLKKTS